MSLIQHISTYLLASKNGPNIKRQFLNWSVVKSIIIIAYDNQLADVVNFINTCKKNTIDAKVLIIYDGKPENAPNPSFEYELLSKKQFNWFYIPNDDVIETLNQKQVDVLINLSSAEQLKAKALSKLILATCKVGTYEDAIFDVSIVTTKNSTEFLEEVYTYLNMIKTT